MKPQEHELKTIEDILEVVNADNLDNFIKDFHGFLTSVVAERVIIKTMQPPSKMKFETMIWTDDGKHNIETVISLAEGK